MDVLSSRILYRTADLPGLRQFYEDVLGLHVYREYGADGRTTGVVFFLGGGFLEITGGTPPSAPIALWLQVADVHAEQERLRAAGVRFTQEATRMPWGLIECWAVDPDGSDLVLVQVPEDHPLRRRL